MKEKILGLLKKYQKNLKQGLFFIAFAALSLFTSFLYLFSRKEVLVYKTRLDALTSEKNSLSTILQNTLSELEKVKSEDQYLKNKELEEEIKNINEGYKNVVSIYEDLLDFKSISKNTQDYDKLFAESLNLLAQRNYASASTKITSLSQKIKEETQKITSSFQIPENIASSNTPPSSGYSRQRVQTEIGSFMVSIVAADLNSTRVIVDTASDSDCHDNCPVLALADYISRNGAFAGVNGSYFCPASYPSCAGKTNSFDTLLMNKNKTYFNSDNNVYSNVPAVIFSGNSARFITRSLEWGRDTGVDAVIANQPLLVLNGSITFGGDDDPKKGSKGNRSFIGATGSTVYIGVVHNATVAESARVLHAMGIQNALNLDNGGSTALWSGGYKVGPGRNIPNALLFIRK